MQAINTLLDIVSPYFTSHKDAPAVRFDDGETILVSTYSQLQKSTDQVTAALHRMEVKDEIVGICISPSQNLPAVLLGVLGCGAAFYNFEPSCVNFARHVVREMGVRVVLVDQDHLQKVESLLLEFDAVVMRDLWMLDFGLILIHLRGQTQHKHAASLAYCITTSGTTGLPKTVRVPHQCIVPNITHLRGIFNIADHDLIFLSSPLTFDPSIVDIFLALGSGACLLIVPHVVKMKPKSLLRMLYCRHKVTYLQATPSLVSRIGPEMLEKTLLGRMSHLKTLAFGGEKFPSISLLMKWRGPGNSTKFFNLYGTTEVSCWSTCYEVTQKDFSSHTDNLPLGQPLTDTIAIVLGDNGQQVKEGRGQLFLGGLRRRQCYLAGEEPDQRPPVLRGTGDTVSINNKGEITFLHRTDDQVKRNGQRINLCEIEKVVTKQEAVGDCRVLFYQRKLIVFVLLKETKTKTDSQIVLLWIQTRLPSQYWPDHVVMVSEFPVTTHGKLDKKALLQKLCDEPTTKNDSVTPGRITVVLETIWKEVLRTACHTPDVDSNFITSGGDSLTAVQFSDKVESSLNIKLPRLLDLVLHNTYKDIITYIEMCVNRAKSPQQMCMEKSVDIDESALKKGGTGNVNSDNFDIVVSVLNDEKRQFDISSSAERKDFYRKRKYDDKSEEIDLADAENRCKESLTFGNETGYKMVCENTISSVGRGNRGIICPNLKGDLMRANCLVRSERSLSQTYECNINSEHTNIDETQGHDSNMTLEICWKVNTGKCVDASPVIARHRSGSNTVFIGSHSHKFFAINLETGELQWEITLGDRIESSACVSMCGQYVIVGCYDWSVYVVERLTGDIWWKYKTGAEVKSSPAVDPQTSLVYIGSHDKHLHALDIKARTCLFKTYLGGGSIFSSPSVSSTLHTVYVGTLSGALSAVNSRTGYILWTYDCKKPLFSSPCVSQDGLYIGCVDGSMYHLSLDGKLVWSFATTAPVFSSPVICQEEDLMCTNKLTNQLAIYGSHDHCVYFLSHDGTLLWKRKLDSPVYSTPFCFNLINDEYWPVSPISSDKNNISFKEKFDNVNTDGHILLNVDKMTEVKTKSNSQEMHYSNAGKSAKKNNQCEWEESEVSIGQLQDDISTEDETRTEDLKTLSSDRQQHTTTQKTDAVKCHGNGQSLTSDIWSGYSRDMTLCVIATTTGSVHVFDMRLGHELGMCKLPGEVFSSPVVCGRNIVIGCRDDFVYCLRINPAT